MATVVPNRFGESLERSTQNLMNLILTSRQLALEEERIGIARQAQSESERVTAMNRLIAFAPFLPDGKSIAELPQLHSTLSQVFPEFDPTNPGDLGGVVLNQQSLEDVMRPLLLSEFERMSPEAKKALTERGLNREILGVAASGEEIKAQEGRATMFNQALDTLRQDPQALEGIMRTTLGLQQPIRVNVGGRTLQWDTAQAASIAVQLMTHSEEMGLRRMQLSREETVDLAGELMKQMESAGAPISRSVATSILSAYNQKVALSNSGRLTPENDPLAPLMQNENPDVAAAAQFFVGAGQLGEQSFNDFLAQAGPAGQQALTGITIMSGLKEAGVPADNIMGATDRLLEALGGGQPGSPFPGFKDSFWGTRGFEITAPNAADVQSLNASPTAPAVDLRVQAIKDVVSSGRATREQAVAKYGEDLVAQALGPVGQAGPTREAAAAQAAPRNSELAEAEAEFEAFMAPVRNLGAAQQEARRNSATGRRLQRKITRLRGAGE